jgi:hypothetical protein
MGRRLHQGGLLELSGHVVLSGPGLAPMLGRCGSVVDVTVEVQTLRRDLIYR